MSGLLTYEQMAAADEDAALYLIHSAGHEVGCGTKAEIMQLQRAGVFGVDSAELRMARMG